MAVNMVSLLSIAGNFKGGGGGANTKLLPFLRHGMLTSSDATAIAPNVCTERYC